MSNGSNLGRKAFSRSVVPETKTSCRVSQPYKAVCFLLGKKDIAQIPAAASYYSLFLLLIIYYFWNGIKEFNLALHLKFSGLVVPALEKKATAAILKRTASELHWTSLEVENTSDKWWVASRSSQQIWHCSQGLTWGGKNRFILV